MGEQLFLILVTLNVTKVLSVLRVQMHCSVARACKRVFVVFGCGRVNSLCSVQYGTVFCICTGNCVDNLGMFLLLLSSALDTGSRPFLLLRLP